MTIDFENKKDLPWLNERRVLREVDLRGYGATLGKVKQAGLWKNGVHTVMAILSAENVLERKKEAQQDEK